MTPSPPVQPSPPLDWTHPVTEVGRSSKSFDREAVPVECAAIASALSIPAVERLSARYRLEQVGNGRYRLAGSVSAALTQTCVVTLEPVEATLDLPLEAEFRHDADRISAPPSTDDEESEILALPDFEPIEDNKLAVGRVVFETLGAGLDPYPRKAGVTFDWTDVEGARAVSPFAALARLKKEDP